MTGRRPTAIDLFSGAGGVTQGLRDAGFDILSAVELDAASLASYRLNHPDVDIVGRDIRRVDPQELIAGHGIGPGDLDLLTACAPCQGYSSLNTKRKRDDERDDLVLDVLRFVDALRPKTVAFENVPRLGSQERFGMFVDRLRMLGYGVRFGVVDAADHGVPQRRRRLLAMAVAGVPDDDVRWPVPDPEGRTVRSAFADLPELGTETLHHDRVYPDVVLERIRHIAKPGGSRDSLPPHLRLACHDRIRSSAATASYGRMLWDEPSPTITSRCTVPSCGRFIHPDQDRAITLREAARLQAFLLNQFGEPYAFDLTYGRGAVARQIGNAVPVALAQAIGAAFGKGL